MSDPLPLRPFAEPVEQPTLFTEHPLTVRQVVDWYWTNNVRRYCPIALKERRRIQALFVALHGDRLCCRCRPLDLVEFVNQQRRVKSDWSRKRWATTLQTPFNTAAKVGLIGRNPFAGLTFPEGDEGRDITWAEFRALLRESPPHFRRILVAVRFSGARPGELRTALWEHVNFEANAIIKRKHKTSTTQKEKRPRRIELNHVLVKLLLWIRRRQPADERHIFLNSFGGVWTIDAVCKQVRRVRKKTGLPDDVKLYGARHAFATWAIMNGVDPAALKELMGHQHLRTTERYVHVAAKYDHLHSAAEKAIGKKASQ